MPPASPPTTPEAIITRKNDPRNSMPTARLKRGLRPTRRDSKPPAGEPAPAAVGDDQSEADDEAEIERRGRQETRQLGGRDDLRRRGIGGAARQAAARRRASSSSRWR